MLRAKHPLSLPSFQKQSSQWKQPEHPCLWNKPTSLVLSLPTSYIIKKMEWPAPHSCSTRMQLCLLTHRLCCPTLHWTNSEHGSQAFFFYPVTAGYLHKSKQELSTGQHTELQAREEALSNDPCPPTSHATTLAGQSGALSPYYPLLSISDPMQPLVLPPGHFKSTPQPCSL